MESIDMTVQNIEKIGALFPNCITETKDANGKLKKAINFDLLRQMLSGDVIEGDEAFEFTWVGKKASIVEANKPIRKTLRPYKEESVNWDSTENLYIEGDNLAVLKLLQESYLGRVKMIYIDPPYNTGHDFVYPDSFVMDNEDYSEGTGYRDENGNINYSRENSVTSGKYHSDWCSMIFSRLLLARNLLSDDGLIFISINEIEQANLEEICNEVFGSENHITTFVWKNKYGPGAFTKGVASLHEFILCYGKNYPSNVEATLSDEEMSKYKMTDDKFEIRGGYITQPLATRSKDDRPNLVYPLIHNGKEIWPNKQWIWEKKRLYDAYDRGEVVVNEKNGNYSVRFKQYLKDEHGVVRKGKPLSLLTFCFNQDGTKEMEELLGRGVFDFPKPTELIKYFLSLRINEKEDEDFIVLDFFSGSASTADALMQLNAEDGGKRKFIMVQVAEKCPQGSVADKQGYQTIPEIGKERIRRAAKKIAAEHPDAKFDGGFRVLKLDDTNMKDVYYAPADYQQNFLDQLESNIKEDRTDLDLLFGCLLEWGLPLSLPYQSENIDGCTIHNYNDGDLIACFDENIPDSVIKAIAKRQPLRVVFRDSSFAGSPTKINVTQIFKELAPDTSVKVL
ncbi:site-specific DNA-methyltransferase [Oribacterium sp. HCP3S3_B9]|uniref:site-specific DNA-methyltransferase n=1 Tax=Oribacterium sp. HCP3S3_B9 TaxID=3438946 RepID=UPI003F88F224